MRLHQRQTMLLQVEQVRYSRNGRPRFDVRRLFAHVALRHVPHHSPHHSLEFQESAEYPSWQSRVLRPRRDSQPRSIEVVLERDDDQVGIPSRLLLHPPLLHDRRPRQPGLTLLLIKQKQ